MEDTEDGVKDVRPDKKTLQRMESARNSLRLPYDESISGILRKHEFNFVLSDPSLPDNAIVYASEGFCKMTGYSAEEVIGRNCRFLQGVGTDRRTVVEIRDAIREEKPCQVQILNYKKDGTPFWNLFHMAPVFCPATGRVVHYVGVQTPVSKEYVAAATASPSPSATPVNTSITDDYSHESGRGPEEPTSADSIVEGTPPGEAAAAARAAEAVEELAGVGGRGAAPEDASLQEPGSHAGPSEADDSVSELSSRRDTLEPYLPSAECHAKAATAVESVVADLKQRGKVLCQRSAELEVTSVAPGNIPGAMMLALTGIQQSFVLADPKLPDLPIVHASDVFCQLTGYSREEVVGRNCRFLQGPETDPESVLQIRKAIEEERACTVRILNYRKDGQPFWNCLHVAPVRCCKGKVSYYVGVQLDVTAADGEEFCERGMGTRLKQLGVVGKVRVAVRGLQGSGLRRTLSGKDSTVMI